MELHQQQAAPFYLQGWLRGKEGAGSRGKRSQSRKIRVTPLCCLPADLGQPCASVYPGAAASLQWRGGRSAASPRQGGAKSPPNLQPGAHGHGQGRCRGGHRILLHFSLPSQATLAGKGKRCLRPAEPPPAASPSLEQRRGKQESPACAPALARGHAARLSPRSRPGVPPARTRSRLPFPKGNFQSPERRPKAENLLPSPASSTSRLAAVALREVTKKPLSSGDGRAGRSQLPPGTGK